MSDGSKGNVGQLIADIGEAVVKPVVDEVGKAIEEGAQSVAGTGQFASNPDPQEQQKKKQEEQKRKAWALKVIDWNSQLQAAQQKVRQEDQQKLAQKTQQDQETKKVKQYELIQKKQKQQNLNQAQLAERKAEIKRGVGG